jgi:hypothetical protein
MVVVDDRWECTRCLPRPGALRVLRDGKWIVANPHDPLYSTMSMVATEYFTNGQWHPIIEGDGE